MTATVAGEHASVTTSAEHEVTVTISVRPPFSFEASLRFLCSFPATRGEQEVAHGALVKAWTFGTNPVVARVTQTGEAQLTAELRARRPIDEKMAEAAADRIAFFLSADDDLTSFYARARTDAPFARVTKALHGYHQVKLPSPVENVCWAILAQRTPAPVARAAKQRLMAAFPNAVEAHGGEYVAFPSLAQLASLSAGEWVELVGNARKAGYLYGAISRLVEVPESFLRAGERSAVETFLLSLPGIGPWSASFVLIRGLGRMEHAPDDPELHRAAERVYGRSLSSEDVQALAAAYGEWQGYWAHYLRAGS